MKLLIQIPCYNEEKTLPLVFENMPREIPGIDQIEYQIIDDGSTDRTVEVAKELGVDHIVRIDGKNRRWLGRAFKLGIDNALKHGADIVVNTDGDNQYPSHYIPQLIEPILEGKAHVVIGDREPGRNREFSLVKRLLQRLGSRVVQALSGKPVFDAVSGFRAYSRRALLKINPITNYTYTVDTLMQAFEKGLDVTWIRIEPNAKTRESRLITSLWAKVSKSGATILRMVAVYKPFRTFVYLAILFLAPGLTLLGRFLFYYFFIPAGSVGKVQSVVVGGVFLLIAVQMFVLGIIAELLSVNRIHVEELLTRVRRLEADSHNGNGHEASS